MATADDLDAVIEVGTKTWRATYPPITGEAYVEQGLARWWTADAVLPSIRDGRVRVAEQDGRIVGMASYALLDDAVMMWKLYVLPEAQRSGVGRALVDAVAGAAEGRPVLRATHLLDNHAAHAAYERMGFHETGRVPSPIDGGPEEMVMERPIS